MFPVRGSLRLPTERALREVVGELDAHLKVLSRALSVKAWHREHEIIALGQDGTVSLALDVVEQLYEVALAGQPLGPADVDQACRLLTRDPGIRLPELLQDSVAVGVGRKRVHPRSRAQRAYLQAIREHPLTFGVGPAGTGKTWLAMAMAVDALLRNDVQRLVLCRPAVEAGEKLGFLPGDLAEKVNPYLRPLFDALNELVGLDKARRLLEKGVVEVAPLAFMRGRTLSGSFIILDEAQNTSPEQMKMFLTRIGPGSRAVVTGDVTQVDLPRGVQSGLVHALGVLEGVHDIATIRFTDVDVVRHPLVSAIIRAYDRAGAGR
jgi:phosphate starvation-inducible PhoH-like protein